MKDFGLKYSYSSASQLRYFSCSSTRWLTAGKLFFIAPFVRGVKLGMVDF